MKNFVFNEHQRHAFEETQVSMGSSVENNHLLAALIERLNVQGGCEIIQKKVV